MDWEEQTDGRKPPTSLPDELFGFSVVGFIGYGAGSTIYAVVEPGSKQVYAIKHVKRRKDRDIRFVDQLRTEYEIGRQFIHPGLRRSIDLIVRRSIFFEVTQAALLMEMFEGVSLDTYAMVDWESLILIFAQIARALEALNQMGYVHCDLKPNNILVNSAGLVKIIDFGQTVQVGTVKERIQGTPDFISPEQVKLKGVTPATDVFNFGATLYWSLCGKKIPTLFTAGRNENSFLVDSMIPAPVELNPYTPPTLSTLAMDCIHTQVKRRPSMKEVVRQLEAIEKILRRERVSRAPSSQPPRQSYPRDPEPQEDETSLA